MYSLIEQSALLTDSIPRLRTYSQNMMVAARQTADKKTVGIVTAISQEPLCSGQIDQQGSGPGVIADLASRHEEPDRAAISVCHRVQLHVHAAFGPPDQVAWTPLLSAGSRPYDAPSGGSRRS